MNYDSLVNQSQQGVLEGVDSGLADGPLVPDLGGVQSLTGRPELVFGFVAPLGTDLDTVVKAVDQALQRVGYSTHEIKLTQLLRDVIDRDAFKPSTTIDASTEQNRIASLQTIGDEFRARTQNDALAILALAGIRTLREDAGTPSSDTAYLVNQLKHPAEVHFLRAIFGDRLIVVGAGSDRSTRQDNLAHKLAGSGAGFDYHAYEPAALDLINIDEFEDDTKSGQNVRNTFPLADLFVDPVQPDHAKMQIDRFVDLLFSYPYHTPSIDEVGMRLAKTMSLRSAAMSRQVGASVLRTDGTIMSVGANDVPKAGGGVYWPGDEPDQRDHHLGQDSSNELQQRMVAELLEAFRAAGWLESTLGGQSTDELVQQAFDDGVLQGKRAVSLVEFGRTLHAEMNAILDAGRYETSLADGTLYSTTYPCHECTRHIIGAGLARVVFVDPYPKSLADTLHKDALSVDGHVPPIGATVIYEPFVGVAPRRFDSLFEMRNRKDPISGKVLEWDGAEAPVLVTNQWGPVVAQTIEPVYLDAFLEKLRQLGSGGEPPE